MVKGGIPAAKKAKGTTGKGLATKAGGDNMGIGEVRYDEPKHARLAVQRLNGKPLNGRKLTVEIDPKSTDQSKLKVYGIPKGAEWQELKDHFAQIGTVAFADVTGGGRKNKTACGEVRFDDPAVTAQAVEQFNGSQLMGTTITVIPDPASKDNTKLLVTDLPAGCGWQDLKDHFAQIGHPVAFVDIRSCGRAEVRFDDAAHARLAVETLHGSELLGSAIKVELDPASQDGSKLNVWNLSPATSWQDVKDHFAQCGTVAFADIKGAGKGKASGGKGGGKNVAGNMGNMQQMQQMMGTMQQMMNQFQKFMQMGAMQQMMNMSQQAGKGKGKGKW